VVNFTASKFKKLNSFSLRLGGVLKPLRVGVWGLGFGIWIFGVGGLELRLGLGLGFGSRGSKCIWRELTLQMIREQT